MKHQTKPNKTPKKQQKTTKTPQNPKNTATPTKHHNIPMGRKSK